jgi:hypothetical protein
MPDPHEMTMTEAHEGTQEWECPICGRRLLIEWHPWRKVTLEPGDEHVAHMGSIGGLRMNVQVEQE